MATNTEQRDQERAEQQQALDEMDAVYERYVAVMERDHWGEFVAVSRDGRTLLGSDHREVTRRAADAFGPGNYIYKIGPRAVGRL